MKGTRLAIHVPRKPEFYLSIVLVAYLFALGVGAVLELVRNFPEQIIQADQVVVKFDDEFHLAWWTIRGVEADQGLLMLAALAGIAGSFIHAAQSLASYLGNRDFKASWTVWYVLRPWIGGTLGLIVYLAFRAGLVAGPGAISPYGVTAFGALAGWFSKTTTDKMQEVFETLFKTDRDEERRDKLTALAAPMLKGVSPSPVPAGAATLSVSGTGFQEGATVLIGGIELSSDFVSSEKLDLTVPNSQRPASGTVAKIRVKNPEGGEPLSEVIEVIFD